MARARNIKPGLYKNEDLAECSIWARYIFPGLWMLADREGRLEDRPKRIKAELLAFDSQDVDPLLDELEARGFLERYQNSEGSFIQISKFLTHQTPHYSEKKSVIKPPNSRSSLGNSCDDERKTPGEPLEHSENPPPIKRGSQPPDSLNPDSLYPPTPQGGDDRFNRFWKAYPRKQGKGAAEKAFARARLNGHFDSMLTALERQKQSEQWQKDGGQFIPNPATWINQRRWEDEIPGGSHPDGTSPTNPLFAGVL